jgi:hypothetical protein
MLMCATESDSYAAVNRDCTSLIQNIASHAIAAGAAISRACSRDQSSPSTSAASCEALNRIVPIADRRPAERSLLQPLPDQHQARPVPRDDLDTIGAFAPENEIVPENPSSPSTAGKFGTMRDDHPQLRRDHIETLGSLLANPMHRRMAAGAIGIFRLDRDIDPRQLRWLRPAIGTPLFRSGLAAGGSLLSAAASFTAMACSVSSMITVPSGLRADRHQACRLQEGRRRACDAGTRGACQEAVVQAPAPERLIKAACRPGRPPCMRGSVNEPTGI